MAKFKNISGRKIFLHGMPAWKVGEEREEKGKMRIDRLRRCVDLEEVTETFREKVADEIKKEKKSQQKKVDKTEGETK